MLWEKVSVRVISLLDTFAQLEITLELFFSPGLPVFTEQRRGERLMQLQRVSAVFQF